MNGCIKYNERLCNFNSWDMLDKNAFIVISKNYIVSHQFCICDVWNFISFMTVDFGDNLVCYWNKTFRLRGIEFLINNELDTICYKLILLFGQKTISNVFFISTTNHNFLWIHNNNANAFSLLRNTSCLVHCSKHFISFSTFL